MKPLWSDLVVGTWNTHVGLALEQGGLRFLQSQAPRTRLWLLQEVRNHQRREILKQLGPKWAFEPVRGHLGRDGALSYVAYHEGTFEKKWDEFENIGSNPYDRARVTAGLYHRRSGRLVVATSVHVDPLGKGFANADPAAREKHAGQVAQFVRAIAKRDPQAVVIDGGDWNERLSDDPPPGLFARSAIGQMSSVDSAPAFRRTKRGDRTVRLDDVFVRSDHFVVVKRRRLITPPHRFNDHTAVVVRLRIKRKR